MTTLEICKEIATKVFGLIPCTAHADDSFPCYAYPNDPREGTDLKNYSENHDLAWAAADKVDLFAHDSTSLIKNKHGLWEIRDIDYQAGDWATLATAETIPMVLCLATLKVVEARSAPAAPPQNSGPKLIEPISSESFKGKSFIETMLEGIKPDAEQQSDNASCAPAAPPKKGKADLDLTINKKRKTLKAPAAPRKISSSRKRKKK